MANKDKFYKKWYFWVSVAIALIGIVSLVISEDCSECEREVQTCKAQINEVIIAWDNYVEAFKEYCEVDYTNPLCINSPLI